MRNDSLIEAAQAAGFSTALILPAIMSTLRQAQREASPALAVLAAYAAKNSETGVLPPLSPQQNAAAARVSQILTEQTINGPLFFMIVRVLVLAFGPVGGMVGQIAITANTMANPENYQTVNPGRWMAKSLGNWYPALPASSQRQLAAGLGRYALVCGHVAAQHAFCGSALVLGGETLRTKKGVWHAMIDRPAPSKM